MRAVLRLSPRRLAGRPLNFLFAASAAALMGLTLAGGTCAPNASDRMVAEGNAYFEQGDYRHARTRYHQAIAIDPQNPRPYYALGVIAYTQGSYSSAVINFRRAIGLDSRQPDFWFYLGNAYAQMGDYHSAVDSYEHVVAVDRMYPEVYYARGIAHYNLREWDYALGDLESYLRVSPNGDRRATATQLIDSLRKSGIRPPGEKAQTTPARAR